MTQTGGLKQFVDNGTHNSPISAEDSNKIDDAYRRGRIREANERASKTTTIAVLIMFAVAICLALYVYIPMIVKAVLP